MSQIDYIAIGERLRAYRIGRQLNADQIAEKLQISRAAVYRLELGKIFKLETLERLAVLLEVSLSGLIGSDTEYFDNALGYFERMRQLEAKSTRILSYFDPFSYLLTSPAYNDQFVTMLGESRPKDFTNEDGLKQLRILSILNERKETFLKHRFNVRQIISLRQIERFLHIGLVGRLDLPPSVRMERALLARREVEHLIDLIGAESNIEIFVIDDSLPSTTFQIFEQPHASYVAVSPYRLGELPNIDTGIASVASAPEVIDMYKKMTLRLLDRASSGKSARKLLTDLLAKL